VKVPIIPSAVSRINAPGYPFPDTATLTSFGNAPTLNLMNLQVGHDEWFRAEVEKGRAAVREGRLIEHDDIAARMDRRYRG
jgi:hypothetical protein